MTEFFQAEGFIRKGKIKDVRNPEVKYATIIIGTDGIICKGKAVEFPGGFYKYNIKFQALIPWSKISNIQKLKERIMHVIVIDTTEGDFFTILPLDPTTSSPLRLNAKVSKRNAEAFLEAIKKAQVQITNSKETFCTNCGEKIKPDAIFCGNCGYKFT